MMALLRRWPRPPPLFMYHMLAGDAVLRGAPHDEALMMMARRARGDADLLDFGHARQNACWLAIPAPAMTGAGHIVRRQG